MTGLNIGGFAVGEVMEWKGVYRDPLEMYPDATKPEVDRHRSWLEPHSIDPATGNVIMAFRSYLIRTERLTILVDACVGNDKERPVRPNWHRRLAVDGQPAGTGRPTGRDHCQWYLSAYRSCRVEHEARKRPLGADVS